MFTFIRWISITFREITVGVWTLHSFCKIQGFNFNKHIQQAGIVPVKFTLFPNFPGEEPKKSFSNILMHPVLVVIVKVKKICNSSYFADQLLVTVKFKWLFLSVHSKSKGRDSAMYSVLICCVGDIFIVSFPSHFVLKYECSNVTVWLEHFEPHNPS